MRMRRGFTLIELLVVIAILALLGAMLTPVILNARRSSLEATSFNNMKQMASAILDWRQNVGKPNSNVFPGQLSWLFLKNKGGPFADGADNTTLASKLMLSPLDNNNGSDQRMGRNFNSTWDDPGADTNPWESGCSYVYECSLKDSPWPLSDGSTTKKDADGNDVPVTWADYKRDEKQNRGYPVDSIPLIRDFHNYAWQPSDDYVEEVLNISWSTTAYKSTPKWQISELGEEKD